MCATMTQNDERAKLQSQIDENLKRVYQEALEQSLPDRFKELLEQLRKKDSQR